jgi:hypothetical protein
MRRRHASKRGTAGGADVSTVAFAPDTVDRCFAYASCLTCTSTIAFATTSRRIQFVTETGRSKQPELSIRRLNFQFITKSFLNRNVNVSRRRRPAAETRHNRD